MNSTGSPRVMRWFTHEWHTGELGDQEYEAACVDYEEHMLALTPLLPADAQVLCEVNLHDGQVQDWSLDDRRFAWRLLIGDLQRGHEFVDVVYDDAELVGIGPEALATYRIDRQGHDLVSDEIDAAGEGLLEHRF